MHIARGGDNQGGNGWGSEFDPYKKYVNHD